MNLHGNRFRSWVIVGATLFAIGASAHANDLAWRVSVKVILDADGNRSAGGNLNTDAEIQAAYDQATALLVSNGSPYGFEVTEIIDLSGYSQWFDAPISQDTHDALEDAAEANPAGYLLRSDAFNVYVLAATGVPSGWSSRSWSGEPHIYIMGQSATFRTALHEAGHFVGLCHTHGCVPGGSDCFTNPCVGPDTLPPSDGIGDTLPDKSHGCWDSQEKIACFNFDVCTPPPMCEGVYENLLTDDQRRQVDDVWFNLMSYHGQTDRTLTVDQLDVMAVTSNQVYAHAATGIVHFVGGNSITTPNDLTATPHTTIPNALVAAELAPGDDVLVIRPGVYDQGMMINQTVCLRASRGNVVIGE